MVKDSSSQNLSGNLANSSFLLKLTSTAHYYYLVVVPLFQILDESLQLFTAGNCNLPSSPAFCQKKFVPVSFCQYMLSCFSPPHRFDWSRPAPSDACSLYPSSSSWKKNGIDSKLIRGLPGQTLPATGEDKERCSHMYRHMIKWRQWNTGVDNPWNSKQAIIYQVTIRVWCWELYFCAYLCQYLCWYDDVLMLMRPLLY